MCTDVATESGTAEQLEDGKAADAMSRPSPKHLAVGAQPLPCSSSSEDIENGADDQVDIMLWWRKMGRTDN